MASSPKAHAAVSLVDFEYLSKDLCQRVLFRTPFFGGVSKLDPPVIAAQNRGWPNSRLVGASLQSPRGGREGLGCQPKGVRNELMIVTLPLFLTTMIADWW